MSFSAGTKVIDINKLIWLISKLPWQFSWRSWWRWWADCGLCRHCWHSPCDECTWTECMQADQPDAGLPGWAACLQHAVNTRSRLGTVQSVSRYCNKHVSAQNAYLTSPVSSSPISWFISQSVFLPNFVLSQILHSINIWHPFGLTSQISGLTNGSSFKFFCNLSYCYLLPL